MQNIVKTVALGCYKFYLPKGLYTISEVDTTNTPGSKHSNTPILSAKNICYR